MKDTDKICYCFHVSKRKIINFIRLHKPRVPSQISECQGAGTGCGWCIPYLKKYFREMQSGEADQQDAMTAAEYANARASYIKEGNGTPPPGAEPLPNERLKED